MSHPPVRSHIAWLEDFGALSTAGLWLKKRVISLIAFRNPKAHKSLIWFTVCSSVIHGAIMGVEAVSDPAERGHLLGDIPALFILVIVLSILMRRGKRAVA